MRIFRHLRARSLRTFLVALVAGLLAINAPKPALSEDCMECHAKGPGIVAPETPPTENSAHQKKHCNECHPGQGPPCSTAIEPVSCKTCHLDQVLDVGKSSHGGDLVNFIKKQNGLPTLAKVCLACHGEHAHTMKSVSHPLSPAGRAKVHSTCLECHREPLPVPIEGFPGSIHATATRDDGSMAAVCVDCHHNHRIQDKESPDSSINRLNVPGACGTCHEQQRDDYIESEHWQKAKAGDPKPPVCINCHGEHATRSPGDPSSRVWVGNITKECAGCHGTEPLNSRFETKGNIVALYRQSYHGLSAALGDLRVANCASCHGNHAILPPSNPRSMVSPANLGKTCGACHPGAEKRFIEGPVHVARAESHYTAAIARALYISLIIAVIGAMLAHNALDLAHRLRKEKPAATTGDLGERFSRNEKIQHAALAISFILLAYSGFALRFPESILAVPLNWSSEGAAIRAWIHRGAAMVFVTLLSVHILYVALSKRGREQLRLFRPRKSDLIDIKAAVSKNLGGNSNEIQLPHYSYVEKIEYWAMIWGAVIMTATGFVLLFVNMALALAPLWLLDLAGAVHYYEAILAVLALLAWHGYWVVFDPRRQPRNLSKSDRNQPE